MQAAKPDRQNLVEWQTHNLCVGTGVRKGRPYMGRQPKRVFIRVDP
jgi:hypothetical protein